MERVYLINRVRKMQRLIVNNTICGFNGKYDKDTQYINGSITTKSYCSVALCDFLALFDREQLIALRNRVNEQIKGFEKL